MRKSQELIVEREIQAQEKELLDLKELLSAREQTTEELRLKIKAQAKVIADLKGLPFDPKFVADYDWDSDPKKEDVARSLVLEKKYPNITVVDHTPAMWLLLYSPGAEGGKHYAAGGKALSEALDNLSQLLKADGK
jgi:hypothetical protein